MKCSYCETDMAPGQGVTIYKKDGSAQHYCCRRCEKFVQMKRHPRQFKWTNKRVKGKAEAKKKK